MLQHLIETANPDMAVNAILDHILTTGQVAQKEAHWLLQAGMTLETSLSAEAEAKIKKICHRLDLGVLKVIY